MSNLDDCIDIYRDLFLKKPSSRKNEEETLLLLVENLTRELEVSRESELMIHKKLQLLLNNENSHLTKKYAEITEEKKLLEEENKKIKFEINQLKDTMEFELETQKNKYIDQIQELEKNTNLEIANLKNKMESDKIVFEKTEKELLNEIELAKAAASLQCDEVESNLKRQLVDLSSKLRQSQNIIRQLNFENGNLKQNLDNQQRMNQSRSNIYFNETPIRTVKNAIINNIAQYRSPYHEDRLVNPSSVEDSDNVVTFKSNMSTGVTSVRISHECEANAFRQQIDNNRCRENYNMPITLDAINSSMNDSQTNTGKSLNSFEDASKNERSSKFERDLINISNVTNKESVENAIERSETFDNQQGLPKFYRGNNWQKKNCVPKLMPCTSNKNKSNNTKVNQKKRKLYNPDDIENLPEYK